MSIDNRKLYRQKRTNKYAIYASEDRKKSNSRENVRWNWSKVRDDGIDLKNERVHEYVLKYARHRGITIGEACRHEMVRIMAHMVQEGSLK